MSSDKIFNRYYSLLYNEANKSTITSKLSAIILKNQKLVSKVCCNLERNFCRGFECSSLHAEANAILSYYGKLLQYDTSNKKWYLKLHKYKESAKT